MNTSDNSVKIMKNLDPIMEIVIRTGLIAAAILLIPLIIMLTTDEMNWSAFDYIVVWLLLFSSGITFKLLTRKKASLTYRAAVGLAVATGLFMMWVNLAVGIVGSGPNAANLLYAAIPAIGLLGTIAARFKAKGMATTLFVMASVNTILCIIAVIFDKQAQGEDSSWQIIAFNFFFIVLWVAAGLLFQISPKEE